MFRRRLVLITLSSLCTLVLLPIVTNIATGELPEWSNPYTWLAWPALAILASITMGLVVIEVKSSHSADDVQAAAPTGQADANRHRMLEIVRQTWIDGYLKHSLQKLARIELGLEEKPDAVSRPYDLIVQPADQVPRPLPAGISIGAVFNELGKAMLILGSPGAGKTTLLLELTDDLLDQAERDTSYPIPVVFPLSSWAVGQRPLADWLADELNKRYYVPKKLARAWIDTDQILPLLDGLDEVASEHRTACIEAINAFRQEHGLVPLVVCCRMADYDALPTRVQLSGVIAIQPLSQPQISAYLEQAGEPLAGVRAVLRDDETLWELLKTPLMLSVVALAYQGQSEAEVRAPGPLEERRAHLFAAYTRAMFERRTKPIKYTREQTIRWLGWLARSLMHTDQSDFYVEWLQPDWLPSHAQQRIMTVVLILFSALVFGFVFGLGGALGGSKQPSGLGGGFVFGLVVGLIFALFNDLDHITPAETLRWSWKQAREYWSSAPTSGDFGLMIGGLITSKIVNRTTPNEGIRRSLRSALTCFLIFGFIGGIVGMGNAIPDGELDGELDGALGGWLIGALGVGLGVGLNKGGGFAYLQHYLLRILLWRNDYAPLNYIRFLDYAAERVFLRKVGGGYIFTHRLLMEYFATLEPSMQAKAE
jgi:hypothetical protein